MIFLSVLKQVVVLVILIALGALITKKGIFTESVVKGLTDLVLYFVAPCVIIKSFVRENNPEILKSILLSVISAVAVHLIYIVFATVIFRNGDEARRRVLRFGTVFGNCGYMSLPLQEALLGADGVIFCAGFIAVFNLFAFSYGMVEMSGDSKEISMKKVILNPAIISLPIGLLIFIFSLPIPEVIYTPISYLAGLNTPIPMMIIGYHLAKSDFKTALRDAGCMLSIALKLVLLPVVALAALYLVGLRGDVFVSVAICACANSVKLL